MIDSNLAANGFREAVSVEAEKIFDSCADRTCISDQRVTLTTNVNLCDYTVVKATCVDVTDVCITLSPMPFNKGFYSVDITYTFGITMEAYTRPCDPSRTLTGTAVYTKKSILYGGEGGTKTFYSDGNDLGSTNCCCEFVTNPRASVQVVEPIALSLEIQSGDIYITIGLFSIIQLTRPVSVIIPAYEYCKPAKACSCSAETPCEIFDKIKFPTEDFCPGFDESDSENDGCCGLR